MTENKNTLIKWMQYSGALYFAATIPILDNNDVHLISLTISVRRQSLQASIQECR